MGSPHRHSGRQTTVQYVFFQQKRIAPSHKIRIQQNKLSNNNNKKMYFNVCKSTKCLTYFFLVVIVMAHNTEAKSQGHKQQLLRSSKIHEQQINNDNMTKDNNSGNEAVKSTNDANSDVDSRYHHHRHRGLTGRSSCLFSQLGPGCGANSACEAAVCNEDPWCCEARWDNYCTPRATRHFVCACTEQIIIGIDSTDSNHYWICDYETETVEQKYCPTSQHFEWSSSRGYGQCVTD